MEWYGGQKTYREHCHILFRTKTNVLELEAFSHTGVKFHRAGIPFLHVSPVTALLHNTKKFSSEMLFLIKDCCLFGQPVLEGNCCPQKKRRTNFDPQVFLPLLSIFRMIGPIIRGHSNPIYDIYMF